MLFRVLSLGFLSCPPVSVKMPKSQLSVLGFCFFEIESYVAKAALKLSV